MVASNVSPDYAALPRHVAIIMDGNGRWAEQQGLPRTSGHSGGIEPVREAVRFCAETGIDVLTLFAFSSENFDRPADEVARLMTLFVEALESELDELDSRGVELRFVGNRDALSPELVRATRAAEARTEGNDGLKLVIAFAYGGRWDIVHAARCIAERVASGSVDPATIDEAMLAGYLSTAGLPAVDLLIRTGGEQRISNFLLWDLAYSELYFSDCLWPEFNRAEFADALRFFATRQRRYGRTGAQAGSGAC